MRYMDKSSTTRYGMSSFLKYEFHEVDYEL